MEHKNLQTLLPSSADGVNPTNTDNALPIASPILHQQQQPQQQQVQQQVQHVIGQQIR